MIDLWLAALLFKMAAAAAIVVACSVIAERSGPLLAAMIATLPISSGPVYVFLALEHDAAFIAAGSPGSVVADLANAGFSVGYILMAQRFGTVVSLGTALAGWLASVVVLRWLALPFVVLVVLLPVVFGAVHLWARPYLAARPSAPPPRAWFIIPMRAAIVALVAGGVTALSNAAGPSLTGVLATMPVVLSSLCAFLQPRIGGPATAAVIANSQLGLIGFGFGLASLHVTALPLGVWGALAVGLVICVAWNGMLMALDWRRRTAGARRAQA